MTKPKGKNHATTRVTGAKKRPPPTKWTFLTIHAHVLLCLYRQSDQRDREVASLVGITERMVQRIIVDLVEADYITIQKEGRRNRYRVNLRPHLRHPLEQQLKIGELLRMLEAT